MRTNKMIKFIVNTLVYLIGVLTIIAITLSVLATLTGDGDKSILELF